MTTQTTSPPDALLFITPGCVHCPAVLQGLSDLLKQTLIGKLTVINVAAHPEEAEKYGVRAAPWLKLGPFTLTGAQTPAELKHWVEWCSSETGYAKYFEQLLEDGSIKAAGEFVSEAPERLQYLLTFIADPEKSLIIRAGASAILESYQNKGPLQNLLTQLAKLSENSDHRVRADACHLLGMSGMKEAKPYLQQCLNDSDAEVREIASESLQLLATS